MSTARRDHRQVTDRRAIRRDGHVPVPASLLRQGRSAHSDDFLIRRVQNDLLKGGANDDFLYGEAGMDTPCQDLAGESGGS